MTSMLASTHILFYAICFDILTIYWYVTLTYVNVNLNKLVRIKIGANTVPILKYKYEDFLLKKKIMFVASHITYYSSF